MAKYVTVSLPASIAEAIDEMIDALGYWPSRGAFVREACLEKVYMERRRLKELSKGKGPDEPVEGRL